MLAVELFHQRVRADADHDAVVHGRRSITYGQLNARANRLAHWLRGRGVSAGEVIGVHLGRGIDLAVAVLAAHKASVAYVPIDPVNPHARVAGILSQVSARLVLCGAEHLASLSAGPAEPVAVDTLDLSGWPSHDPELDILPDDLAYVVYTSGSTGTPKGVMVTQRGLQAMIDNAGKAYGYATADRCALVCSPSFDVSASELWLPLVAGATIDVADTEVLLSAQATIGWLAERAVTITAMPNPLTERMLRAQWPTPIALRAILTGGEQLHVRPDVSLPFTLINNYGPTENTVVSTFGAVSPHSDGQGLPSIGTAVTGVSVEILDEELRAVVDGEVGEIYLGGAQLARGYYGRADLTADRFVPHPSAAGPGQRLYRTGDLGRRRPDGEIDFVGRADDQIKLRGHRIELGEITAVLGGHPELAEAYVIADHDPAAGERRLVAYVAPKDPRQLPASSHLRTYLRTWLPDYMVPSVFVIVDALPHNTNGKVDRAALPAPRAGAQAGARRPVPTRTGTEHALAEIWGEVLHVDRVGLEDSFFDLGGHSLVAAQIIARVESRLGVRVPVRELFVHSGLEDFAAVVDRMRTLAPSSALPPIQAYGTQREVPLSMAQQQIWFLHELAPQSVAYHAQATIRIAGPLDLDILARALTEIHSRHDSLRTVYVRDDNGVRQVVQPPAEYPLRRVDLSEWTGTTRQARRDEVIAEELSKPFDLGSLPLQRWTAIRFGPDDHELLMVEHHLVHDGWSFSVFSRELELLYNAFSEGKPSPLGPLPIQYADYVRWQEEFLDSPAGRAQLDYWRDRLDGLTELDLATDRPRPKAQSFQGNLLRLEVPAALSAAIRDLGRREAATLYMVMYAAFTALLHRYTGGTDVAVLSGFANRRLRDTEGLIGMLVNPAVLRTAVAGADSFQELLQRAKEVVLAAADHQECPFPMVVQALGWERDPARNPLSQIMFSAHDSAVRNPELGGAVGTVFEHHNGSAKTDLNVIVIPRGKSQLGEREHLDDRVSVLWEYNTDLFDAATMRAMADAYLRLLAAAVAEPDTPISRLPVLDEASRRRILVDWNEQADAALPRPTETVCEQVWRWVRRTPDATAVDDGAREVTFGQLGERAARLAARLSTWDPAPERVVAICLPRCADLVAAELAVMMTGSAFLPIDPGLPVERIRYLLGSSGAIGVITSSAIARRLNTDLAAVLVDNLADGPREPLAHYEFTVPGQDDLAYVIYTSGSTGEPKGVMVTQYSFANLVAWHRQRFALTPADRTTAAASPGFDFSLWELWPALAAGGSVHMPADTTFVSAPQLEQWLLRQGITVALLPTPIAEAMFDLPIFTQPLPDTARLRCVHAGGQQLTVRPQRPPAFEVFNTYGPTENTMISTSGPLLSLDAAPAGAGLPDIGRPITGTAVYILDEELNAVPVGVRGEVYLGGAGLARGYLGRPGLTADRFVPHPLATHGGQRLYRTGDLARYLPDGSIDFLGRADAQVQIRGHRVEPGEVTAWLRAHPKVRDAYTATHDDSARGLMLVCYVVPVEGVAGPTASELRDHVARMFPSYMVPAAYLLLDELPLTRNGKLDRRALPAVPAMASQATDSAATAPSGGTEQQLALIWQQVLGLEGIGRDDSFFDLGGHSLLLVEVHRQLASDLDVRVPLVALFEHPTLAALARFVDNRDAPTDSVAASDLGERRRNAQERMQRRRAAMAARASVSPGTDHE